MATRRSSPPARRSPPARTSPAAPRRPTATACVPTAQGGGPEAAIDGDPKTYWDETDNQKLYWLQVQLKAPATVVALRITAFGHHSYAPRNFEILCDNKVVKKVIGAIYQNSRVRYQPAADDLHDGRLEDHRQLRPQSRDPRAGDHWQAEVGERREVPTRREKTRNVRHGLFGENRPTNSETASEGDHHGYKHSSSFPQEVSCPGSLAVAAPTVLPSRVFGARRRAAG